ncbi:MAG TPA: hypothetical protein VMQ81_00255 [Acidimicrobiia bacterium]|nr:hypothetical protein [Acidimicrobiia bacterium]
MRCPEADLAELAAQQHAIFSRAHALGVGFSPAQIKRRLRTGAWVAVHQVAYRVAGAPITWEGELLAACWAGGFRAVASHRSAAALWDLPGGRRQPAEIVCPRWRRAQHDGLIVHESKALDRVDTDFVRAIPVTKPELTLLQMAAVCHPAVVEMAFDAAEKRELVSRHSVQAMLQRQGKQGRNGAGVLRELLAGRKPGRRAPESAMETRLIQALRKNGFPEPLPQYEIRAGGEFIARVDVAYPQWKIAIEYDSDEYHAGQLAHRRDSTRRSKIVAAGWLPLSATLDDIKAGCMTLCAAIRTGRNRAS